MIEPRDVVRDVAAAQGARGLAWLEGLEDLVADLARRWRLTLGRPLAGGTASFTIGAVTEDGELAVLKLAVPGLDPSQGEAAVLNAADGRGYAKVLRHDAPREALLLERLGPQLNSLGLTLDAQMEIICATLRDAWRAPPPGHRFTTGAERAAWHTETVTRAWSQLGKPCSERAVERALDFAEQRRRAFDPEAAVMAHGDAHAWNTLQVLGERPPRFKFVDPDGLFVERAFDLAISMREWPALYLAGDPIALGRRRCRLLADLAGVEAEPIWQWGFLESLANGISWAQSGREDRARDFLRVADAWALAD